MVMLARQKNRVKSLAHIPAHLPDIDVI